MLQEKYIKMLISIENQTFQINEKNPVSIAIPLDFYGAQPNVFEVERAVSSPCRTGRLIGDTRRGGSVNFEQVKLIPHCNGTHTECVGHITHKRISVHDCLQDVLSVACLISVFPEKASDSSETYAVKPDKNDLLITKKILENALSEYSGFQSLIIRTLPNDESKLVRTYTNEMPPFFSTEAMNFVRQTGVRHLLVDMPSIDRLSDEGKLSNHRIFWNMEQGSFQINESTLLYNTITELIFVPAEVSDGIYLLNLQIAPFVSDAAPSRPILFRI